MENAAKTLGFISATLIFLGSFFKIQHWPFSGIMLILGVFLFSIFFLAFYLIHRIQSRTSVLDVVQAVLFAIFAFFLSIGMLFTVQHWPGQGIMLNLASGFLLLAAPISLMRAYKQRDSIKGWNWLGIFLIIAAIMMGWALQLGKYIIDSYTVNAVSAKASYAAASTYNEQIIQTIASDTTIQFEQVNDVHELVSELTAYIDDIERELVVMHTSLDATIVNDTSWLLSSNPGETDMSSYFMLGSDPIQPKWHEYSALELKERLRVLSSELLTLIPDHMTAQRQSVKDLLATKDSSRGYPHPWEVSQFYQTPFVSTILTLTQLRTNILQAEAIVISSMTSSQKNH